MILKELDPVETADPLVKAGRKAEEQMAHYLRRAFGDLPEVYLFHDLRLERDGDAAQIDHLLLHRYGVVIIESKSVSTQVEVNERGEWCRNFRGQRRGMPSPIEQARRQGEFLRVYLQEHREQLRNRALFGRLQGGFRNMPIEVLVAISDDGVIRRPKRPELPEVLKADQIPGRVQELLKEHRRANSFFNVNLNEGAYEFSPDEVPRICAFLLQHHRPRRGGGGPAARLDPGPAASQGPAAPAPAAPAPRDGSHAPAPPARADEQHRCRTCQSDRLSVEWGRYGYYFKCLACSGNTPIRETCGSCGEKEKLRKSGRQFFAECAACATSRPYFLNSA